MNTYSVLLWGANSLKYQQPYQIVKKSERLNEWMNNEGL